MIELMRPGESVAKSLRRLGGGQKVTTTSYPMNFKSLAKCLTPSLQAVSQSQRWKKKRAGTVEDPKEKENKEQMLKLTGIADEILTR